MANTPHKPIDSSKFSSSQPGSKTKAGLLGHLLGLLVCVGFPGFVSLIAPVSWVYFERHEEIVSAHATSYVFFVVPYKTQNVPEVDAVDYRIYQAQSRRSNGSSRSQSNPMPEGFLMILGKDGRKVEVQVAPSNVESVRDKARAFLQDSQPAELKMFVVSNWIFGIGAAGLLSLLTLLYIFGLLVGVIQAIQRLFGVPPERLFFAAQPVAKAKLRAAKSRQNFKKS